MKIDYRRTFFLKIYHFPTKNIYMKVFLIVHLIVQFFKLKITDSEDFLDTWSRLHLTKVSSEVQRDSWVVTSVFCLQHKPQRTMLQAEFDFALLHNFIAEVKPHTYG